MRRDATKIMLIDYEYCGWQPRAFDLANYLNEVAFDNTYPYNKGIALYPQNLMGEAEVRDFLTQYLRHEHTHLAASGVAVDDYVK
jgi:thiamine kinase-like enzyme